jgi:hypothetical protein
MAYYDAASNRPIALYESTTSLVYNSITEITVTLRAVAGRTLGVVRLVRLVHLREVAAVQGLTLVRAMKDVERR